MREQSFLTAAVQNMKRLAKAFFSLILHLKPVSYVKTRALSLIRIPLFPKEQGDCF